MRIKIFIVILNVIISEGIYIHNNVQEIRVRLNQPEIYNFLEHAYKVLPQRPLNVIFEDFHFKNVKCQTHTRSYEICDMVPSYDGKDSIIVVKTVTDDMSDIWRCTVYETVGNYSIRQFIYFEIVVLYAKPPQLFLVNNEILTPHRESTEYYAVKYYYQDGDQVDVACISSNHCGVHKTFLNGEIESLTPNVRYRFNLKDEHIKDVGCVCSSRHISFVVKFVYQNIYSNIMNFKINGRTVKGFRETADFKMYYIYINYGYYSNETLTIVCNTNQSGFSLSYNYENTNNWKTAENNNIVLRYRPYKMLKIIFVAQHNPSQLYYEKIVLTFKSLNMYVPLVGISQNNNAPERITATPYITSTTTLPEVSITTGDKNQELLWVLVPLGLAMLIVLVCVSVAIYKMKKQNRPVQRGPNCYDHTPIPSYPAQWKPDATTSENQIYDKPNCSNPNTLYSNLLIETQRKGSKPDTISNNEIQERDEEGSNVDESQIYATVDANPIYCNKISSGVNKVDVYAQVLPKSERNQVNYAGIMINHYENRPDPEYIQSTYSEICFKNN